MTFINKFTTDFEFGITEENNLLDKFAKRFDADLVKTPKNHIFDFKSEKYLIELKTRRNTKDQYPDTMIGQNKIDYAIDHCDTNIFIFAFSFIDGLFYYEFNKDDLENGGIRIGKGGRSDRGKCEFKSYCYIKTSLLIKMI